MHDLRDANTRLAVERQLMLDIDAYAKRTYGDGYRSHLGASVIGHECARYMWYAFRWCIPEDIFDGRMLRLFQRGHLEELRYMEYLKGIGCKLKSDDMAPGQQHRISDVGGHFGGSLDDRASLPQHYAIAQPMLLAEFKTKNAKSFAKLVKDRVVLAEPRHYAQMCTYGVKEQLDFALYMNTCKDNDEMHIEIVPLDHGYGNEMIGKGHAVITSAIPPRRIAATETFYTCKLCDARSICWHGTAPPINCRSCKYAEPRADKVWFCNGWQAVIPDEAAIRAACPQHTPISA